MIRSVDSQAVATEAKASTAAKTTPHTTLGKFADELKKVKATHTDKPVDMSAVPIDQQEETWSPVKGVRAYVRIETGPRNGQYVNIGDGPRHMQVFSIEQRDGKAVHVYGSGDTEQVFDATTDVKEPARRSKHVDAAVDQPAADERWAKVPGHPGYSDILNGKRNGLYVNTSGGVRTGMAFQLVHRGGHTYHVYEHGSSREVIEVGTHKQPAAKTTHPAAKTTHPAAKAGGSSGGASAG